MKKIHRLINRSKYRIMSLLLAALMILSSIGLSGLPLIVATADGEPETENVDFTIRDDALHFFIRHWHTREDESAAYQGGQEDQESGKFFVVVEGYILPNKETKGAPYTIVLCNQKDDSLIALTYGMKDQSPYIKEFDLDQGTVTLNILPIQDSSTKDPLENFCGLSLSAGRDAVDYNYIMDGSQYVLDENGNKQLPSITIKYSAYTHLVKGHVFYNTWSKIVAGTTDSNVLSGDPEVDTAEVYTWLETNGDHKVGDVVLVDGKPVSDIADLPANIDRSKVKLTKFYSAVEGLHTDLTMIAQDENGRLFLFDLEAWYIEGYAAQLGFVLDASGSMAFTSDRPSVINVYDAIANRLGVEQANGQYVYKSTVTNVTITAASTKDLIEQMNDRMNSNTTLQQEVLDSIGDKIGSEFSKQNWKNLYDRIGALNKAVEKKGDAAEVTNEDWENDFFLGSEELALLLNTHNTANTPIGVASYSYFVYDGKDGTQEYTPIGYWAGVPSEAPPTTPGYNFKGSYYSNREDYDKYIKNTASDGVNGWPSTYNGDMHMSSNYGYHFAGIDTSGSSPANPASAGLVLDVKPTDSFTVSFTLTKNGADPAQNEKNIAEILFIGSLSGDVEDEAGQYYRLYRDQGSSSARLKGVTNADGNSPVTNIDKVFDANGSTHRITLVFEKKAGGNNSYTVTSYIDGSVGEQTEGTNAPNDGTEISFKDGDIGIVLNGFKDYYNGAPLFIKDLYVFNDALESGWIKSNLAATGSVAKDNWVTNNSMIGWYKFANDKSDYPSDTNSRSWLKNSAVKGINDNATDADKADWNTSYGAFACKILETARNYSMNNWKPTTEVPSHATVIDEQSNSITLGELVNSDGSGGWFYISHSGWSKGDLTKGTAKRLFAMASGDIKDNVDLPGKGNKLSSDTEASYTASVGPANRFYIDSNGDLRCFFSRVKDNEGSPQCSYVYELSDNQYVKTEALQRILANFAVNLFERSPSSQISAVKFSGNVTSDADRKRTVLLDWSHDPQEIAGIMSQTYGDRTANGYEVSARGLKQYNYALTGNTSTQTGLQTFYENLVLGHDVDDDLNEIDENVPKFLIVFTDGLDTDMDKVTNKASPQALEYSQKLKDAGYTIMGVYLPAGTDYDEDGNFVGGSITYEGAMKFLKQIVGKSDDESDSDGSDYVFVSTALEGILEIFEQEILAKIVDEMDGYTVQNYIDPRFNLQTANGTTWQLKSGGKVEIRFDMTQNSDEYNDLKKYFHGYSYEDKLDEKNKNIRIVEFIATKDSKYTFHISGNISADAHNPYLRFDSEKDMYYLVWRKQTIATTPTGSETLRVWNAYVLLEAKDDFIGGNAVITNGNEANMNWVYHPGDVEGADREVYPNDPDKPYGGEGNVGNASSGTNDRKKQRVSDDEDAELLDAYPSKGFPRATVNVRLKNIITNHLESDMFMGEVVSPAQLLTYIKDKYITESYYLEYLKRYAYQRYLYYYEQSQAEKDKDQEEQDKEKLEKLEEQMNMPLLNLLHEWLEIDNDEEVKKSFSIPYMYLPGVEYNDITGKIELENGKAKTIFNNTGSIASHGSDVLGILTYQWEQIEPEIKDPKEPTKDFVKQGTERSHYSITVEFTPLREGDKLDKLNECDDDGKDIFAGYIPINASGGNKTTFDEFEFDRAKYVNETLITEKDADGKTIYPWKPEYKPASYDQQLQEGAKYGEGDVEVINNNRTVAAYSDYILDTVSGGIALEMKMLVGEVEAALDTLKDTEKLTMTMKATRTFKDTEFAEALKSKQSLDDYGTDYTLTYEFDYTKDQVKQLEQDSDGYVKIFAKAKKIEGKFGSETIELNELPIGTYQFTLADASAGNDGLGHRFTSISHESKEQIKKSKTDYTKCFDELVLNGLATTNENPQRKWRDPEDESPEINKDNIDQYVAEAASDKKTATFYIGTSSVTTPNRGNVGDVDHYTNARLGIIVLSTGTTKLRIKESNGAQNENFLYRITGTTLGGKAVDLVVSVKGKGVTTIDIVAGNYTITEISDWSWKYQDGVPQAEATSSVSGKKLEDAPTDWIMFGKNVQLTLNGQTEATVTYAHTRNDKQWRGGECYVD